jgi:hypothetical protein
MGVSVGGTDGPVLGGEVRVALSELLADPVLEAGERPPIRTHVTVHADVAGKGFGVTLEDEWHERRVWPEIAGVEHFDARALRKHGEVRAHPFDEDAGAEEPGEGDDPSSSEEPDLLERFGHARPRDAREARHHWAATHTLGDKSGGFAGIGVGIGIRRAAGEEQQRQSLASYLGDAPLGES